MVRYHTLITVIGFVMAGIGLLSLVLSFVGVDLFFMGWLRQLGPLAALLVRLGLIIVGFLMIYIGQTDWEREEA